MATTPSPGGKRDKPPTMQRRWICAMITFEQNSEPTPFGPRSLPPQHTTSKNHSQRNTPKNDKDPAGTEDPAWMGCLGIFETSAAEVRRFESTLKYFVRTCQGTDKQVKAKLERHRITETKLGEEEDEPVLMTHEQVDKVIASKFTHYPADRMYSLNSPSPLLRLAYHKNKSRLKTMSMPAERALTRTYQTWHDGTQWRAMQRIWLWIQDGSAKRVMGRGLERVFQWMTSSDK